MRDPGKKLQEQAVESTIALLESENIANIIYVDDKFDVEGQKEVYKGLLINFKESSNPIESEIFNEIDWEAPRSRFERLILDLWDRARNKIELLNEVYSHVKDDEYTNIIPTLTIKDYFSEKIIVMTPDQWNNDNYETIKSTENGKKVICLFDFEFQYGDQSLQGRNGAELAGQLINKEEYSEKVICGIFSHKFHEEEEDDYRMEYSKKYKIDKNKFYTISKHRFDSNPQINGFAEGIKNLLLLPHVEELKDNSLVVLEESNKTAAKRIKDISPKTFNQIIQKSSLKEGVWEISTLFRLYGILSKEENYNVIADPPKRKKFNQSINKIRSIDAHDTGYTPTLLNKQLIKLRNSEIYLDGNIINKLHMPLVNGDVFEIKNKEYILLVQPCNLALRASGVSNGKRNYDYKNGMLVPLKYITEEQNRIIYEKLLVTEKSNNIHVADLSEFKIISLDILDLSVFNADGRATINLKNEKLDNNVIHSPWLKRYQYIHKTLLSYEENIKAFKPIRDVCLKSISQKREELKMATQYGQETQYEQDTLKEEIKRLKEQLDKTKKKIYELQDLTQFKINCTQIYNEKTRVIDTQIKRVRRYKAPYSNDLLQKFMQYLSRNAFEHDFTIITPKS